MYIWFNASESKCDLMNNMFCGWNSFIAYNCESNKISMLVSRCVGMLFVVGVLIIGMFGHALTTKKLFLRYFDIKKTHSKNLKRMRHVIWLQITCKKLWLTKKTATFLWENTKAFVKTKRQHERTFWQISLREFAPWVMFQLLQSYQS